MYDSIVRNGSTMYFLRRTSSMGREMKGSSVKKIKGTPRIANVPKLPSILSS
jgi:hypothetical protein